MLSFLFPKPKVVTQTVPVHNPNRTIYFVNKCKRFKDLDIIHWMRYCMEVQINRDFAPLWGFGARLEFNNAATSKVEQIIFMDNSDQAGALGYHERSIYEIPCGFVFVETAISNGDNPWTTAGHETLEQLSDPLINCMVQGTWNKKSALFFFENCDPVENDEYTINGFKATNFTTPYWFLGDDPRPKGLRTDYMNVLGGTPLTLSKGGYLSYCTTIGQWQQAFGSTTPAHQRRLPVTPFSRTRRRILTHVIRPAA